MFEIEETVAIERPIGEVWAFVDDETNDPVWQPTLIDAERLTEGPVGVGTRVRERRRFLGRGVATVWEVVQHDPPRRSAISSVTAPFPWGGGYALTRDGAGTRLTATLRGDPGGFFRVAQPVLQRMVRRELAGNLANLKDILEAGLGATGQAAGEAEM